MKKNILIFILAVILLFTPFVVVATSVFATPCQYDETFLGELKDKHTRLSSIKEEKIVFHRFPPRFTRNWAQRPVNRPVTMLMAIITGRYTARDGVPVRAMAMVI